MTQLPENIIQLSAKHGFKRSAGYNQGWVFDNSMGPNPLWLVEWLTRNMKITSDMTVLDMGCGKALTSIFLAKEFGCTVFANDLWIPAEENLQRITQAGLANKVFPFRAEAHALPYAKKQFDAIISVDAYQYFGTDDLYLAYFSEFLKPGGLLGLVMAGWTRDFDGGSQYWPERIDMRLFGNFHTLEWWRSHLEYPGIVKIESAEHLPNVKQIWQDSARAMYDTKKILRAADGTSPEDTRKELDFWQGDIDFLEADKDNYSTIMAVSAIKI